MNEIKSSKEEEVREMSNQIHSGGDAELFPRPALLSIRHPIADDAEIESYARGLISGTMKAATPNVVGSLLARIRQLLKVEDDRARLQQQIQDLNRGIRNRAKCGTCGSPLSSTCPKCQQDWES